MRDELIKLTIHFVPSVKKIEVIKFRQEIKNIFTSIYGPFPLHSVEEEIVQDRFSCVVILCEKPSSHYKSVLSEIVYERSIDGNNLAWKHVKIFFADHYKAVDQIDRINLDIYKLKNMLSGRAIGKEFEEFAINRMEEKFLT